MNTANVTVLGFLFVALATYVARYWISAHQRELSDVYRYRLFAVRDRLVRLAVEEKIDEIDESFRFLYYTVNRLLPVCRPVNVHDLLRIVASKETSDTEWEANFERALHHEMPEIRAIAMELTSALVDIMIYKSITVRLASRFVWLISGVRRFMPKGIRTSEAYRVYRQLDHLRRAT